MEKNDSAAVQIMLDGLGKEASSGGVMMGSSSQSSSGSAYQRTQFSSSGIGKAGPSGYEQMAMRDGSEREIVKMTPHGSEQMHQGMQPFGGSDAQAVKYSSGDIGKAGPSGTEQIASGYVTAQQNKSSAAQAIKFDPQDTGKAGSGGFEQIAGTGMETESISAQGTQTSEAQAIKFDPQDTGKAGSGGFEQIAGTGMETESISAQGTQTSEAQAIKFDPSNLGKEGPTGTEQIAGSGQLPERRYYGLVRNTEHGTEPVYPQAQYYGDGYAQSIKFDPSNLGKEGPTGTEQIMSFDSMDRREYINTDGLQQIIQNLTSIKQRLTSFSDSQRALKENMHRAWNGTTGDKAYEKLNKYENKYNKYIKMVNKRIRFLRYVIDQYTIWENEIKQKIDDNFSKKM